MVRQFARHCSATDPRTIVPPPDLLSYRYRRPAPYIYRDDHITQLLRAAKRLRSDTGLRSNTYATILGLYVVTGVRCNEALNLDRNDVDLVNGVLTIRGTKFGKSRYLPLHLTTTRVLQRYAVSRDCIFPKPVSPSFFLSERGTRLNQSTVENTFVRLSRQIGLRRCATCCARSGYLVWAAGSRVDPRCGADRAACCRTSCPSLPRCRAQIDRARLVRGEGAQRALHTTSQRCCQSASTLAKGTSREAI